MRRPSKRGSLVFALPLKEQWSVQGGIAEAPDFDVLPKEPWALGILPEKYSDDAIVHRPMLDQPFKAQTAPLAIKVKVAGCAWAMEKGAAGPIPERPERQGNWQDREIWPYGCTTLRLTEIPSFSES